MKKEKMTFWIVTGMSGAGKSQAINCFEDFGFYCVDNLPVALLPKMAELCAQSGRPLQQIALGIDIRERGFLRDFFTTVEGLKKQGVACRIIFLDADDQTLYRRFSETRRRHPLRSSVREGVAEERRRLMKIKERADKLIDTSNWTFSELKEMIASLLDRPARGMQLTVVSFGYKYGTPVDADIVWDVRFLPNPNYVPRLRFKTGIQKAVQKYVLSMPLAQRFQKKFFNLLIESLPFYVHEGKSYLTVAVGCTGGRHRSVVMADSLKKFLANKGYVVRLQHRDVERMMHA